MYCCKAFFSFALKGLPITTNFIHCAMQHASELLMKSSKISPNAFYLKTTKPLQLNLCTNRNVGVAQKTQMQHWLRGGLVKP